jgi:hypothetical protein
VKEEEVLELKAELDAEYKRQSETIDNFLEMLRRRKNGVSLLAATQPSPSSPRAPKSRLEANNTERAKRVRGMLKATRSILNDLPETFTTFQVRDKLEEFRPDFKGRIKLDSLRGTLNQLIDEGLMQQIEEGAGQKPAIYKRRKTIAERAM